MKNPRTRGWVVTMGILFFIVASFSAGKEWFRLGHGYQLDTLRLRKTSVRGDGFTHVLGPVLSVAANGQMDVFTMQSRTAGSRGEIQYASGPPIEYRLRAVEAKWESDLKFPNTIQLDTRDALTITPDILSDTKLAPDGSLTARCRGYYFVGMLWLKNPRQMPEGGYISIIMH